MKSYEDVAKFQAYAIPQSIACEVWSLHFQDKLYNSDSLLFAVFSLFRDTVADYSLIMSLYV